MNRIAHENQGNDSRTRSSPQGCGEAVTSKTRGESGSEARGCRAFVGFSLGQNPAQGRTASVECETQPWGQTAAEWRGKAAFDTNPSLWTAPGGLSDRHVDVSASGRSDRAQFRRMVSSRPRLASIVEMGMELPETRTTCSRAAGTGNRALAHGGVAAHKKGGYGGKLASFFSMKRVSCCNHSAGALGLRGVGRRCNTPGTGTIGFRPSPPLPSLPVVTGWDCASDSNVAMYTRKTWCHSCAYCTGDWRDALCSSGIVLDLIARRPRSCWLGFAGCGWNGSQPTRPNSILAKNVGTIRNTLTWPTSYPTISTSSNRAWPQPLTGNAGI